MMGESILFRERRSERERYIIEIGAHEERRAQPHAGANFTPTIWLYKSSRLLVIVE